MVSPTKQLKKKDYKVYYKFALRKQNEEIVPNSFYKNSIPLIPKSEKDKQQQQLIFFINIDGKMSKQNAWESNSTVY